MRLSVKPVKCEVLEVAAREDAHEHFLTLDVPTKKSQMCECGWQVPQFLLDDK